MTILKIIASICLFIMTCLIGGYDYRIEAIVAEIIYSIILIKIHQKYKLIDFFILLSPIIFIEGLIRIFNLEDTFFSLPPFIFKLLPFAIFLIFKVQKNLKIAFLINITLTVIINIFFYNNWLNYVNQGTLTGKVAHQKIEPFKLLNYKHSFDTLNINESSGIKIIDFWAKSCGVCYKKFPKFSELKNNYIANRNITFITALHEEKNKYLDIAYKMDSTYNFSTYIVSENDSKKLNIDAYPTILIFNNNAVIFRGSVETLESFLKSEDFQAIIEL